MTKLSLIRKPTLLTLETSEGDVELHITKFTVNDADRRQKLMNEVFDSKESTELDKFNALQIARLMCSVKRPDGEYFWPGTVAEFKSQNYEMDFVNALIGEVEKLNPLPQLTIGETESALDKKKEKSSVVGQSS